MKVLTFYLILAICLLSAGCKTEHQQADDSARKIEILFLGHDSEHHNSERFMPMLAAGLATQGINFTYTEDPADLNPETLNKYDGLMIYANHETIAPAEEEALMNFVESGKGFIPVHSASFCFQNSQKYIDLVGGQFLRHETGTFTADIIEPDHPAMLGVEEFSTWDETYVHTKLTDDRTVLMERVEGDHHEPWTWVKDHGQGRVFYTAYGHDERTWNHPGFHNLMAAGIIWAVGDQVKEQWQAYMRDMPELQYEDRDNIPNYEQRDPAPRYQLPLSPEESAKLIQVPVGFKLELFASEPDIINPVAMDWDEKGRLWVIETVDYPNTVRSQDGVGDDRIKICEDTDGDGKADKFTVFADQLNIPTSLTFANGGVIVAQAPHFLFLQDTNGDDKADVRKEIITGWGTYDTHAGPSNLKYGMDNYIWGVLGYSGFKGNIAGEYYEFGQGVYRFKFDTDVSDFEYMTRTSNNTWGLGFTESFDVFASTANNTHSVYMGVPDRYLENVDGLPVGGSAKIDGHYGMMPITDHVRQVDVWGGFTAASGHNFYTARNYPQEYWNKVAFVCEPTGHLVHIANIEEEGAGFVEKNGGNFFAGADEWVAPVEAKVGPDGAVWVADWYNFIIQHNPTPTPDRGGYEAKTGEGNAYINPLRDREHGRIWRVVYKDAEPYEPMTLSADDPDGLIEALSHDNMFWRTTAQRLLVERNQKDIVPELYKIIKRGETDDMGMNPAAIHALWTLHGLGVLDGEDEEAYRIVVQALRHPAAGVRKAAVQVMPDTPWANQAILQSNILQDKDPHTRLAATLAIAEMPDSDGLGRKLYAMSEQEEVQQDRWLATATYAAATNHRKGFMDEYIKIHPQFTAVQATTSEEPEENERRDEQEAKPLFSKDKTIGLVLMQNYWNRPEETVAAAAATSEEEEEVTTVHIQTVKNAMKYDVSEFVVEAGKSIKIVFENPDFMQHNLLILQPGTLEIVGAAADELAADPEGAEKNYVPDMEEVLYSTPLVDPEGSVELTFTAPDEAGDYPFVCTFPGHWRIMQGTMKVVQPEAIGR